MGVQRDHPWRKLKSQGWQKRPGATTALTFAGQSEQSLQIPPHLELRPRTLAAWPRVLARVLSRNSSVPQSALTAGSRALDTYSR